MPLVKSAATAAKPAPKKAAAKPVAKRPVKAAAAAKAPVKTPAKATTRTAAKTSTKTAQKRQATVRKPVAAPVLKAAPKIAAKPLKLLASKKPLAPEARHDTPKVKKAKQIRDSFTMPEPEYAVIAQVKKACLKAGFEMKKSDLLRIGISLIKGLDVSTLKIILATLTPLKAGRPKK
jgi:hypothetical protein